MGVSDGARFDRRFFGSDRAWSWIGGGAPGGKAAGLIRAAALLGGAGRPPPDGRLAVGVPAFTVVRTEVFSEFLARNDLLGPALSEAPDVEIAQAFLRASLPTEVLGDLRSIVDEVRTPLAVRSSSLLEDALGEPFAGVYATKMLPNHQPDPDARFRKLADAVKLVYASVFFRSAKQYLRKVGRTPGDESMAVMLQEIVGARSGEHFYPDVSGVARSYNYYALGDADPRDGTVSLALGLGRTIVEGEPCWFYSPARPAAGPPAGSPGELMDRTQSRFWAVGMGKDPPFDPVNEAEYLVRLGAEEAGREGRLELLASTYDAESDRFRPGVSRPGPRLLNFDGLLSGGDLPFNETVRDLLARFEEDAGAPVEIEFALTLRPARLGFLQVRPMVVSDEVVDVPDGAWADPGLLAASRAALGNGIDDGILDVVYLRPERFDFARTREAAREIASINAGLLERGRPYALFGFGRWGSADPWLGVPVAWDEVSGAKVIVEAEHAGRPVEMSQGSHFFHNMISFRVFYFSVPASGPGATDWEWLGGRDVERETELVRHVRLRSPLSIRVDGRSRRGVIRKERHGEQRTVA